MNPFAHFFRPRASVALVELVQKAHERARSYAHDYVGVEHVFLSLRDLPESDPARVIIRLLPIDAPRFWTALEKGAQVVTGRPVPVALPLTPRLRFILKQAARWAKQGQSKEITPSHFVAAVCHERNSLVAHVFRKVSDESPGHFSDAHAAAAYFAMLVTQRESTIFQTQMSGQAREATRQEPSQTS